MSDFANSSSKLEHIIYISNQMVLLRELNRLLSFALNEVIGLFGAERGFIVLREDDNPSEYRVNSYKNEPADALLKSRVSSSIVSKVMDTNESIVVANALSDEDFGQAKSVMHLKLRSVLCVPLRYKSKNIGVIYLENKAIANRFGQDDLPLLELFANQTAVAIVNARLNNSLNVANSKLEKINEQKTQLIQIIAHELRTPATNISLYIDLYRRNPSSKYLERLEAVADQIVDQVHETVLVSTLLSGQMSLNLSMIELEYLFWELGTMIAEPLQERQISCTVQHGSALPMIAADREKLRIALFHILSNAIKFTPDEGQIAITIVSHEASIELQISDSGIGIPQDELEQIFELFHVLGHENHHSSSRFAYLGSGLGIGLPLAKGIVEAHGGQIKMVSAGFDDKRFPGATCIVTLPLDAKHLA